MLTMLTRKTLLLDVDGVIFQHKGISSAIGKRTCSLVEKVLECDTIKAKQINKQLYTQYGHTYIGLKQIYNPPLSLKEYNNYVYDPKFIESLHKIETTKKTQQTYKLFEKLMLISMAYSVRCMLYTNSPLIWLKFVKEYLKPAMWITENDWIYCDHPIFGEEGSLKPLTENYLCVDYHIRQINEWYCKNDILYIDDSAINVWNIKLSNWKRIHLTSQRVVPSNKETLFHIKNLNEINKFIKEWN